MVRLSLSSLAVFGLAAQQVSAALPTIDWNDDSKFMMTFHRDSTFRVLSLLDAPWEHILQWSSIAVLLSRHFSSLLSLLLIICQYDNND